MTAREKERVGDGKPTVLTPPRYADSQAEGLRVLLSIAVDRAEGLLGEIALRDEEALTGPLDLVQETDATALPPTQPTPRASTHQSLSAVWTASSGRHAAAVPPLRRKGLRFMIFSAIGGFVFLMGFAIQVVLTGFLHVLPVVSYLVQAVVSVEASFLLNRWLTWRDRSTPFWPAFIRFNVQKTVTIALNLALYAVLIRLGMNYLIANVALTVAFTIVNYIAGDRLVFVPGTKRIAQPAAPAAPSLLNGRPVRGVSVVIPCRDNERTIGAAVQSLLDQDYPGLGEVILIGSPGDHTWNGLAALSDPRLTIWETETPPGVRDANFKRDAAIRRASGDLIALVDSDIVLPPDWISRAVATLDDSSASCVTGGLKSVHESFWGRYTDSTWIGAKTPRIAQSYTVTSTDFGIRGRKPPITANTLFTRQLYDACPIDPSWSHGSYEDYEWFWRVTKAGYRVFVSQELFGWHHHRRGLRALAKEYRRSSRGCAYFIRTHPDCPLARRRLRQVVILPLAAITAITAAAAATAAGHGTVVAGVALSCAAVLAVHQVARSRSLESLAYPVTGLALGLVFTTGLAMNLIQSGSTTVSSSIIPSPNLEPQTRQPERQRRLAFFATLAFVVVLAVGTMLRLWHLSVSPAWQWDEAVYYRVSVNVQHGMLSEHSLYGVPWEPFLYQPPFYLFMLSRWFSIIGASIYHARLLGVILTAAMQVVLFRLLWKIHGPIVALFAIIPVVIDGWLMYIERVSYIENALMLLIVTGLLLYQRALEKPSWVRFATAGVVIGFAGSFKQTGVYVLLAVLLCWLITRHARKGHLVLLGAGLAVLVAYVVVMVRVFDVPGHDWYIGQSTTQVRRVLALKHSGGTLTSPESLLHLLAAQYRFFIPSALVALAAFAIIARRILQCYLARNCEPVQGNALLFSWLVTGIVVFGLSSLKFPQYFALILIPAYCYFWTELIRWNWRSAWKRTVMATAVVAALGSFALTVPAFSANTLAEVQQYAATQIPASDIVVTEQSIGDLIQQRWCTVEVATACLGVATYAITWRTYLQSSFTEGNGAFHKLMVGAVPVKTFSGAVGTATVWKLRQAP